MFRQAGLDGNFCNLISDMWSHHERWASWGGMVHSLPLVTHGMPISQGECLGPLTCCMWLSVGQRFVEEQVHLPLTSSIYMDDRSFVSNSAQGLVDAQPAWASWSALVGLLESTSKTQMTAKKKAQKDELLNLIPHNWFRSEVAMLGVVTRGAPRSNHDLETSRLQKARSRLTMLATWRLGSNLFAVYARVFCISMCAYGWLSRFPPKRPTDDLCRLVKKGEKVLRTANTWLRCMVHGGISHLDVICACNLFRIVAVLRCRRQISWSTLSGIPVAVLRSWFLSHRFLEVSPWVWRHRDDDSILVSAEVSDSSHLCRMRHLIREGWRFFCWDQFLQTTRREISDTAHVSASQLRQVDWDSIRSLSSSSPACRAVAVGGTVSPAWFHAQEDPPFPVTCPWCSALG